MVLDSQVFISNKTNDTKRDSLEKLIKRVNYYLHKMMHVGEQRQDTQMHCQSMHCKKLYY